MRVFSHKGQWLLLALVLLPTLAAALSGTGAWSGAGPLLNFLGRLAGVAGLAMMLLAAAVSIRIPGLDQAFGGLTTLWRVHHFLGAGAFLLAMVHPLLLALASATISPAAAAAVLWPSDGAIWLGWGGLLAMMLFLAPTFAFFGAPRYQRWKALHAVSALAVVLAFAHTLMLGRALPPWVWWVFGAFALSALAFRLGWRRWRPGHPFRVIAVERLADREVEIAFEATDGHSFPYEAGQFVYMAPMDPSLSAGIGEEHPYTLSSAPQEGQLRITIKDLGDASHALQSITPGTEVRMDGPYGRFFDPEDRGPQLWLGGGIGITPFVARARALRADNSRQDIHLIYAANDASRAYFLRELETIAGHLGTFHVWPHFFSDEGPLRASWLGERCADAASRSFYVCGPAPLLALSEGLARELHIPPRRYHSEAFDLL